jgi:hypothetical protein
MGMSGYGLSLELKSGAATTLAGLPVAAACVHGGRVLITDGVALGRIGGDSDYGAPIAVRLTLAPLAAPGPARLAAVALDGVVAGTVAVSGASEAGGDVFGQAGPAGANGLPGRAVARLGRGYGRTWAISLAADDGAVLDIAAIEARLVPLDRRP